MLISVSYFYLAAGLLAFAVYAFDKFAAKYGLRRVPEKTLHCLSLLGGWPGAFMAQRMFRHKTKKKEFQSVFYLTVIANVVASVLIAQHWW